VSGSVYDRKTAREGFYAFCRVPSLRAAPQWFPAHAVVYAKLFRGNGLRNAALVYIPCPISSFWLFGQSRSNVKYETPFYFYAYILYYTDKKIKPFYTYTSMERERIITRLCVYTFMTYNFFRHVQHIYIYIRHYYGIRIFDRDKLKGSAAGTTMRTFETKTFFIFSRMGATMRSAESDLDCVYALLQRSLIVNGSDMLCVSVGVGRV